MSITKKSKPAKDSTATIGFETRRRGTWIAAMGKMNVKNQREELNGSLHPSSFVIQTIHRLNPYKGRIYDPTCGSGGMFVQSEKFAQSHATETLAVAA